MIIKGDQQNDLRTYRFANGYTLQETMLLQALKTQAEHGLLMTNPRVIKLGNDTPKTCKKLYQHLKEKGYYDS
jgi:hypothetical protein